MSDLFHESLPFKVIERIFKTMNECSWHTFQVLTKRADILSEYSRYLDWTDNIWMGVTVESQRHIKRIDSLRNTPAKVKFISFEPLISGINEFNHKDIDWVIAGGESGPGCRPIEKEWISRLRDTCVAYSIPFFFKQWGGVRKKKNGRMLDNRVWDEMPGSSSIK
jgi:protein gp37